jgi:hypothetical protein
MKKMLGGEVKQIPGDSEILHRLQWKLITWYTNTNTNVFYFQLRARSL